MAIRIYLHFIRKWKCITIRALKPAWLVRRYNTLYIDTMKIIPADFFWDINVRFLSWECWDFWRWHNHFLRFPKKSEVFWRRPKSSKDIWNLRMRINVSSVPVIFTSKIRDREEGIVISSFYTWFSFLAFVRVNIFLEIVSSKRATTHIFQSGMRNWPASMSRCAGLKITAGHRTMSGQDDFWSGQNLGLAVILTGHVRSFQTIS